MQELDDAMPYMTISVKLMDGSGSLCVNLTRKAAEHLSPKNARYFPQAETEKIKEALSNFGPQLATSLLMARDFPHMINRIIPPPYGEPL